MFFQLMTHTVIVYVANYHASMYQAFWHIAEAN